MLLGEVSLNATLGSIKRAQDMYLNDKPPQSTAARGECSALGRTVYVSSACRIETCKGADKYIFKASAKAKK